MFQTQENAGFRVLARDMAQELSADDLANVSGGEVSCTVKATWSQAGGADAEASCTASSK